jgi:heptosyltransferase-2
MNSLSTIIKNILLIFRCLISFVLHGKADKKVFSPKSVVIIQRAKLGDMIVTTSMFRAVKKVYPSCKVTVVGSAINKQVLEGNPDIYKYIVWEDDVSKMITKLNEGQYDFGCMTAPNFHSLCVLYLSGIKSISAPLITNGWSPYETRSYKIIRNFVIKTEHRMREYVPRQFLRLLEPLNIFTDDTTKYIYWSKEAELKITDFISKLESNQSMLIGVMPGAGNKIKQWPAERFSEVADYLIEKYKAYVLIIGSESNRKEIDETLVSIRNKDCVSECSSMSIDELKALVSKLTMTVSVDTGPVFIAEACGVPTLDIAGSIHPSEMSPNDGKYHIVVVSEGEPEIFTMNARIINFEKAKEQIESITVSMVTKKADELIEKIRNRTSVIS